MDESIQGKVLVAASELRDPNFFRSVVLIVEHGEDGTMGLVINRPSSILLENALAGHFDCDLPDDFVLFGGPVEPSSLFILHSPMEDSLETPAILPGICVGNSPEAFESVIRNLAAGDSELSYRIFIGCAGWAPGQLEEEISRGDWLVHDAAADLVFNADVYQIWDIAMKRIHEAQRILPYMPDHPEWN